MWKTALENSALILGIAISIYTVYSAFDRFLLRRRQNKVTIRSLCVKTKYLLSLAVILAKRTSETVEKYKAHFESESKSVELPEGFRDDIAGLLNLTFHILGLKLEWNEEKLCSALTDGQLDAVLKFLDSHQSYHDILTFRAKQLELSPDNFEQLKLLKGFANWNLVIMKKYYEEFERLFRSELKSPNKANSADAKNRAAD